MIKHNIKTTNEIPVHKRPFRYSPSENTEITNQINNLLKQDIIRHNHSSGSAPVFLVPKKLDASGQRKWRLVVDFRLYLYRIPKTRKEIKSFVGLLGYYRRFVRDFAKITKPLTQQLKGTADVTIDENYIKTFDFCKTLLCNDPILQYPDFTKPFILTTDAGNVAIGAVLSQGTIGNQTLKHIMPP